MEGDPNDQAAEFPRHKVEPILFLSKLLTPAERNYWPTEMETAGLVWVVRKTRHLIESASRSTIVFTDHSATTSIARQTHLTTTVSTNKLNLQLVRASQYLSQYNLDVRHRPGKIHLVPNALSRLLGDMGNKNSNKDNNTLDDIDTYHVTLIEMSKDYKTQLRDAYDKDEQWRRILHLLKPTPKTGTKKL